MLYMAGSVYGTAASQYPLAIYLHTVSTLQVTGNNKYQKHDGCRWESVPVLCCTHLEKAFSDCQPSSTAHKLKDMCCTRWVQRIDTIELFKSLHV